MAATPSAGWGRGVECEVWGTSASSHLVERQLYRLCRVRRSTGHSWSIRALPAGFSEPMTPTCPTSVCYRHFLV